MQIFCVIGIASAGMDLLLPLDLTEPDLLEHQHVEARYEIAGNASYEAQGLNLSPYTPTRCFTSVTLHYGLSYWYST